MSKCDCRVGAALPLGGRWVIGLALIAVASLSVAMVAPPVDGLDSPRKGESAAASPKSAQDQVEQGQAPGKPIAPGFADLVNEVMRLTASEVITLQVDPTPGLPVAVAVPIDGQLMTVVMSPHSIRADGYKVHAQIADGSLVEIPAGEVRTLRGRVLEMPEAAVAGSLLEDGLHGLIIFPDGARWRFQPLAGRVEGAQPDDYVLYRGDDVIPNGGVCGVTHEEFVDLGEPAGDEGGIAGGVIECAQLACDADFEYYQDHGSSVSSVENAINAVINDVNLQYETQVSISHDITQIIVRTAEPDPYSSTDAGTLLCQFRNHWNANHSGVVRDVAHLFTGKSIAGGTIGIAFLGVVCNVSGNNCGSSNNLAYSLVESDCCCCPADECASDLSAHELGHNWNASHCCAGTTMNPTIQCANNFAATSISQITTFRDSRTCLANCEDNTTPLPFFDQFPSTTIDGTKWTGIDGATSNTVGTAEPSAPNSLNLDSRGGGLGDEIRSAVMNTAGLTNVTLSYYYQRAGTSGGDSPESGDDLFVEFLNNSDVWTAVHPAHLGSGADMSTYTQVTTVLPSSASHDGLRIRFRCASTQAAGLDDWFVDDVSVTATTAPANNNCSSSAVAGAGSHPFNTSGATTDGPDEPVDCNFNGFTQITNDIWYLFPAQCTGTATISLCGSNFNSKLAVYGGSCPGGASGLSLACGDDGCGDDASVSFPVNNGQLFRVRVGGVNGATGTGTMVISCQPGPPPCPTDVNGDNVTNVSDLLAVIAAWGSSDPDADVNDDGVVNVSDLLDVIAGWGPC